MTIFDEQSSQESTEVDKQARHMPSTPSLSTTGREALLFAYSGSSPLRNFLRIWVNGPRDILWIVGIMTALTPLRTVDGPLTPSKIQTDDPIARLVFLTR